MSKELKRFGQVLKIGNFVLIIRFDIFCTNCTIMEIGLQVYIQFLRFLPVDRNLNISLDVVVI